MENGNKIVIGYIPTRRNVFSRDDALKYKRLILDKIKSFGFEIIDIEDINEDGMLSSDNDVDKVVKKFNKICIDCLFTPHCNFGTESAVAKVAREINKPLLLWGPRDESPLYDGTRLRDTQCGLFATSKILQRFDIPFTYIINSRVNDEVFSRGFINFIRAANVVKKFKKIKIGKIGVRPRDFWTVISSEGELIDKFNIEIVPFNLGDIVSMAKELVKRPNDNFNETYKFVKKNMILEISEDSLKNIIALKVVVKKISEEEGIQAFAFQCWNSLQTMLGVVPCLANSLLFDDRIPVACETDINGAITSLIAQAAALDKKSVFFADLTNRHPEDDNAELLWHCGVFPYSLKKEGSEAKISMHPVFEADNPGICNWEIKGGDISLVRFDSNKGDYYLFSGQAKGTLGPKIKGTYLWIKVSDWSKWEEKIIYGPYIHHVVGIHDLISPVLYEAANYMKEIRFDPIEPSAEEIKNWLACRI